MFSAIDPSFTPCSDGVIAFARGRNPYLPASLCEAYSEVQSWWLGWVDECIRAGVDGLVVRISNHSCYTDHQEEYGFNEPVLAEYRRRYGADPDVDLYDPELFGALRGEFFDQFLWAAKRRLAAFGRRLEAYIEVESFRRDGPLARQVTRPGNIVFNWRDWLRSGLLDEAMLMAAVWTPRQALEDPLGREIVWKAAAAGIPLYQRYFLSASRDGAFHADVLESVFRAGLAGYNLYEASSLYDVTTVGPDRELESSLHPGLALALHDRIVKLGLM